VHGEVGDPVRPPLGDDERRAVGREADLGRVGVRSRQGARSFGHGLETVRAKTEPHDGRHARAEHVDHAVVFGDALGRRSNRRAPDEAKAAVAGNAEP
jgi:hypothetical protein